MKPTVIILDDSGISETVQIFICHDSFESSCKLANSWLQDSDLNWEGSWEDLKTACEEGYFTAYENCDINLLKPDE